MGAINFSDPTYPPEKKEGKDLPQETYYKEDNPIVSLAKVFLVIGFLWLLFS